MATKATTQPTPSTLTLTASEVYDALTAAFHIKRPVFLWGPMGVGKSDIVNQIATDMGGTVIDLRMSQIEATDLRGIPYFNRDVNKMDWAPPIELPDAEFAKQFPIVVLFLDEMNSATPNVQAAGYQLILNRRIGKYTLPDNVVIVAAGNRDSDKGVTYRMPMPLANRFVHLEMRVDFNSWEQWATKNNVHPDVVGYLSFSKNDLFDFVATSSSKAFATPRTWAFVSDMLNSNANMSDSTLRNLVAGAIGDGLAIKFMAHRKLCKDVPNPSDILAGTVTGLNTKEISVMYSLTTSLCYEIRDAQSNGADRATVTGLIDHMLKFMLDNFEPEICVMGMRKLTNTFKIQFDAGKLVHYPTFTKKYGKFILASAK